MAELTAMIRRRSIALPLLALLAVLAGASTPVRRPDRSPN
jgi:hypothetical protein